MSDLARYLSACLETVFTKQTIQPHFAKQTGYPKIEVSFVESGISFAPAQDSEVRFIEDCIKRGHNADTVFKKPTSITTSDGKITGVVRLFKDEEFGSSATVKRGESYFVSIDPIFSTDKDAAYDVGEIVDGNYYKDAKILRYVIGGSYLVGFPDGSTKQVHIRSMKPRKSQNIEKNPIKTEDFANEVCDWIVNSNISKVHGGDIDVKESKSGKKYYSISFAYPKALDGEIQIYNTNFIIVRYSFRGKKDSFTAKSPEEFHDLMTENFGAFIKDY